MNGENNPFWEFSLALYRKPGVPEAAIALQDGAGADVNLLFYLLWLAREGRCASGEAIAALDRGVGTWRGQVVVPLRAVRRAMKGMEFAGDAGEALRGRVKACELEGERLQQAWLAARPLPEADGRGIAALAEAMLDTYATQRGARFAAAQVALLIESASSLQG